LLLNKCL